MTATATQPTSPSTNPVPELVAIPLTELHESKHNPRTIFDAIELKELAESLTASGQLTPILVRPHPNGKGGYEIGAGACRYRAAKLAGLTHLHAVIRALDDATFVELVNVENRQRNNLHALDEARGFADWMKTTGLKVDGIAARIGLSTKYVYDRLKLLQLIPEAQELFLKGAFEAGHAILLARIPPAQQKRAIARGPMNRWDRSLGGLFTSDFSDGGLGLEFGASAHKAVSVREFETWIKKHVRFDPTKEDLPNLFPATAQLLEQAAPKQLERMVFITYAHQVAYDAKAKDGKRTYGAQSWKRADGLKGSKTCERSVVGVVAAGKGRGDGFLVCVNRDRCEVHYGPQVRARLQREAARAKHAGGNGSKPAVDEEKPAKAPKIDPNVLPQELREQWVSEELSSRAKAITAQIKGVIAELKISDEICWNLAVADFYLNGWNKVGRDSWNADAQTDHNEQIWALVQPELPGKFGRSRSDPKDGSGARTFLAFEIWYARDTGSLDAEIDQAVQARWKTHRAAQLKQEAKAPPTKPAKPKKRAGDVRRAKSKAKARAR